MGYELSLHAMPKYGTFNEMLNAVHFIEWSNNPWNHEDDHYPTYESYWNSMIKNSDDEVFPGEPTKECVAFYAKYNEPILIDYWCSVGRENLDDYITSSLENNNERYIVTSDFLTEAKQWADKKYDECDIKSVEPVKSIRYSKTDDDSEILTRIDGVIVEDNYGESFPFYVGCDDSLYYCEDIEKHICFEKFVSAMNTADILNSTGDYFIWFTRSY